MSNLPEGEPQNRQQPQGTSLYLGDKLLWYNPPSIGHFGIGYRKGWYEHWLVNQIRQGVPPEERERRFQEIMKQWIESEE